MEDNFTKFTSSNCSDTVFNLSHRVLFDTEIKTTEKSSDYAPIQRKINEPELRIDFNKSLCCMRIKWHYKKNLIQILTTYQSLLPNLHGNHSMVVLFWKFSLIQVDSGLFQAMENPKGY